MATATLTRTKATNRPDNDGSDTKQDMHVLSEEQRETLLGAVTTQWDEFCKAGKKSFEKVVLLGKALSKLKDAVKNGSENADTWIGFIEQEQEAGNLHFGVRQADRYISIARRHKENKINFDGGCIDFSFGNGSGGSNGGGQKLGEITLGKKGTKEWRGAVRWTANGGVTLTWKDKALAEGLVEGDPICEQAVEIGKQAFSLVAATGDMDVANNVLDFLKKTDEALCKEVEDAEED